MLYTRASGAIYLLNAGIQSLTYSLLYSRRDSRGYRNASCTLPGFVPCDARPDRSSTNSPHSRIVGGFHAQRKSHGMVQIPLYDLASGTDGCVERVSRQVRTSEQRTKLCPGPPVTWIGGCDCEFVGRCCANQFCVCCIVELGYRVCELIRPATASLSLPPRCSSKMDHQVPLHRPGSSTRTI